MGIRGEDGLFGALEAELRAAKEPMDCHELFAKPSVRALASSVNRVSDYLGHLWRKGLVLRLPAPKGENSRSRWMYVWKKRTPTPKPKVEDVFAIESVKKLLDRPNIEIIESDNSVVISLPGWTVTIKQRP